MSLIFQIVSLIVMPLVAFAEPTDIDYQYYRGLTLKVRSASSFKVPMPGNPSAGQPTISDMFYEYHLEFAGPVWPQPLVSDMDNGPRDPTHFYRSFFDRVWLKDGSYVKLGGEQIPLTCIFIDGQDNRFSGKESPLFPEFIMKIYLVANDFSCQGPIRPGWPENGGRKENWDTYVHFEVRDPTIMLPVEAGLRYRWNEYYSVFL